MLHQFSLGNGHHFGDQPDWSGSNQIFLTLQVLASQAFQVIDADGDGWATLRSLAGSEVQRWVEN
jgi:hypothetical protein